MSKLADSPSRVGERREAPRIQLLGQLDGHLVSLDAPMVVLDISLTGTLVHTPVEVPVGTVQDFSLTLGDESTVYLRGRAVRSQPAGREGDTQWFETAFKFIDESVEHEAGVAGLLDLLKLTPARPIKEP